MSEEIRTVTRFQNGYVVYGNPGCERTVRRNGGLKLVDGVGAWLGSAAVDKTPQQSAGPVLRISADPMVEAGARTLVAWLENQYAEARTIDFGTNSATITVPNLPPQEVVNMALMMLRQRGFRVDANYPAVKGPTRTAVVSLRPASLG